MSILTSFFSPGVSCLTSFQRISVVKYIKDPAILFYCSCVSCSVLPVNFGGSCQWKERLPINYFTLISRIEISFSSKISRVHCKLLDNEILFLGLFLCLCSSRNHYGPFEMYQHIKKFVILGLIQERKRSDR